MKTLKTLKSDQVALKTMKNKYFSVENLETHENLEIRPGGFKNPEKQIFFSGKPWKLRNESLLQRKFSAVF